MEAAAVEAAGAYEYGVIERSLETFLAWLDAHPERDVREFRGFRPPPRALPEHARKTAGSGA